MSKNAVKYKPLAELQSFDGIEIRSLIKDDQNYISIKIRGSEYILDQIEANKMLEDLGWVING